MPQRVVDRLEAVEVEQQHRLAAIRRRRHDLGPPRFQRRDRLGLEQAPVEQPGQRVVQRQPDRLRLREMALGGVLEADHPGPVGQWRGAQGQEAPRLAGGERDHPLTPVPDGGDHRILGLPGEVAGQRAAVVQQVGQTDRPVHRPCGDQQQFGQSPVGEQDRPIAPDRDEAELCPIQQRQQVPGAGRPGRVVSGRCLFCQKIHGYARSEPGARGQDPAASGSVAEGGCRFVNGRRRRARRRTVRILAAS